VRSYWLAAAVIAGVAGATPATAQRVWQNGRWVVMPHNTAPMVMRTNSHRWSMRDGRWDAGYRAPGGWNAYRRLHRGATLPGYWMGGDFRVPDYLSFGLAAPPQGYSWVRYYDDAVLVDSGGRVWDSIDGLSWGSAMASASAGSGYASASSAAGAGYASPRIEPVGPDDLYDNEPPVAPDHAPPPPQRYDDEPAPYDGAPPPPPRYHGPYPGGYPRPLPPPPPVVQVVPPACVQVCQGGAWQGGSYYGGAYQYGTYAAGTTVVIIPAAVTTTTTVTEYYERVATRSWHRPTKRILRKVHPRCGCR
jgi:Ni/Co efflux regulator RcnB